MSFSELVFFALYWGALALAGWAVLDALVRPAASFVAAGKLTKPIWLAITVVAALVLAAVGPIGGFIGLPAVIAAVVYLVDVRPAVRELRPGNSW